MELIYACYVSSEKNTLWFFPVKKSQDERWEVVQRATGVGSVGLLLM
jgi:hypothetical protein